MTAIAVAALGFATLTVYFVYPWWCRRSAGGTEASATLPGDEVVPYSRSGYTLAVSIDVSPQNVWPWLIQMGQGRAGFYTHEWIENLLGANIRNADRIIPDLQRLSIGDRIRLTPHPYLGNPGQFITVVKLQPARALVFRQVLPNGSEGSWAYVLQTAPGESTRLIFRRRGGQSSLFDRMLKPGYYFMDMGMLAGIKRRAEAAPNG